MNLRSLSAGTPPDTVVVGSVTRGGRAARARRASGIKVHPRTLEEFTTLLDAAGWTIARVLETALSYHVRLAKQPWMH
jgi:hypothetical protein